MTEVKTDEELNLDQKVTVKSIAGWPTSFIRRDGIGDIEIAPNGSTRLSRNEIISQVQNSNKLFNGIDGKGSHATLYIDDAPTRKEVDFDSVDGERKQVMLNDETVKKLFSLKTQATFEKNLKEVVKTRAEKYAIIQTIRRLGINDYKKILFTEKHTGFKVWVVN